MPGGAGGLLEGSGKPDPTFGLKISPNVVLRNLLQQYPSGGQFFLEALQNADDTGRAGIFCALLDLRKHPANTVREPVQGRAVLQDEAIIFYDDAGFKERDWRSLQFMCDSEKRQSPHEAGAFGMGSRSFFHITDVLQVLSGTRLAALDPDDLLATGHFGEQVDFIQESLQERYPDECAPFTGVFGCDMRSPFRGSLIRASLRSAARAQKCTFMPHAFDLSRARRIFAEFEETLRNGEVILFLTCVARVELWRWDFAAPEPSVIARASLGVSSGHTLPRPIQGPRDVKAFLERFETFGELEDALRRAVATPDCLPPPEILDVVEMETLVLATGNTVKQKWLRCGKFFMDDDSLRGIGACRCVPMVSLALPLGERLSTGCLFASLPLPLPTGLPVHVNAHFRLHDNRRAIWRLTPDLDGEHRTWAEWNDRILTVMVPTIYAFAMQLLVDSAELGGVDRGFSAWPLAAKVEKEFAGLLEPLVLRLKELHILPTPTSSLACPAEAVFFPTPTAALAACRQQLLKLCADAGHVVVDPPEHVVDLLHARRALTRKSCTWAFWEVLLPRAMSVPADELVELFVALIDWASTWQETEMRELAERLADLPWVPTLGGILSTIRGAFDPAQTAASGADGFHVVRRWTASLDVTISRMGLKADAVWRVLRFCGMKIELTWEDIADEADSVASDGDIPRASLLLAHLNARHAVFAGCREAALDRLRIGAWLPSVMPSVSAEPPTAASQLRSLPEVFPPSAAQLVWAVAPTLCADVVVEGLCPGRRVETEPEVLVEQVRALAILPGTPRVPAPLLGHLRAALGALLPLLSRLPRLGEHPRLRGVAFIPCLPAEEEAHGDKTGTSEQANQVPPEAVLFMPSHAAFGSECGHRALSPAIGIVRPDDQTIRLAAEAAGVSKEPQAETLAQALWTGSDASASPLPAPLAVFLARELAARLRAQAPRPPRIAVPTASGALEPVEAVFIDDAPWRRQRNIVTLHPEVAADDGRLLGCPSLRDRLARECEEVVDDGEDARENDDDLVGRVRQSLPRVGGGTGSALLMRLARHADAVGAHKAAFIFRDDAFGAERLVDPRAAELQGASLYICLDRPLPPAELQCIMASFSSPSSPSSSSVTRDDDAVDGCYRGGGFADGGLVAMFRYCDCPQLVAHGRLHFFDLCKRFAVRPESRRRCRRFIIDRLRNDFPDAYEPFAAVGALEDFPTVFRLALRSMSSELGLRLEAASVRAELRSAACGAAEKFLLFAQHLRCIEFRDGSEILSMSTATLQDPDGHVSFFASLPRSLAELQGKSQRVYLERLTITSAAGGGVAAGDAEWAVALCCEGEPAAGEFIEISKLCGLKATVLPFGGAAAKLRPVDDELRGGRLCVAGLPTAMCSGSRCWLSGAFCTAADESGAVGGDEVLPLPREGEASPSAYQRWNGRLLSGPVARSVRAVVEHCMRRLLEHGSVSPLDASRHFALIPASTFPVASAMAPATFDLDWLFAEVVQPAGDKLAQNDLARLLLALMEWVGSWKEADILALGAKLRPLKWVPTECGGARAVVDVFDPVRSPGAFLTVRRGRANINDAIVVGGLEADAVWRSLRLCGMKLELTWDDVAAEAELVVADADFERAALLLEHINSHHAALLGDRTVATTRLTALAWVPASRPRARRNQSTLSAASGVAVGGIFDNDASDGAQADVLLLPPKAAFAPSAWKLVWAVAPTLKVDLMVEELKAGRTVDAEPEIVVEQIRALADMAKPDAATGLPRADGALLEHMQSAFAALLPLLSRIANFAEHPSLRDVAFIPCISPGDPADDGAVLFTPAHAAFRTQHDCAALSPIVGVVKPTDPAIRMAAEAAGVQKAPRADVLAEALCRQGADAPGIDLAVALSVELAARLRAGEPMPQRVMVPTVLGSVESSNFVYIDDAPWTNQRKIVTLHPRISAEDARLLGCSSLRDEMARQCEDPAAAAEGDPFGQEADLVSQVRQLLLEYGESADLVAEFVQNSDDAGAREVAVFLHEETFAAERIVDPRSATLQGVALYICSDNPLTSEDIARMQCVGHSQKRLDFGSSGRFGVGLNVMYRYCDCPQLLANNSLHYFDLTRSYVARANMKRGRQFTVEKLQDHFPDSYVPFKVRGIFGRFPTVFRLALRTERTELGLKLDQSRVRAEMAKASQVAEKLLLFARNLRRLEFHDGASLDVVHEATVADPEKYHQFFAGFPSSLLELKPGPFKHYLAEKTITMKRPDSTTSAQWAIAHRVGVTDDAMLKVLHEQFDQPHGVALLPHGASAVRVSPVEIEPRGGRICCGPPTPFKSGSCAWLQGSFALLSSRKALPLPDEEEEQPSLDKRWNKMLLDGPVAWSMRGLVQHCTALVSQGDFPLERFFSLFPLRGERLQSILAIGTWKAAMNQAVFPVVRGSQVTWVQGPTPTFFSDELTDQLQDSLVRDGMRLVRLPDPIMVEYQAALGRPREVLEAKELCDFLRERFQTLHPGARAAHEPESTAKPEGADAADKLSEGGIELDPQDTKMASLATRTNITDLLKFAVRGIWRDFCKGRPREFYKFIPEQLSGVPLLLTHAMQVTTFCARTKFSNWRDVLPEKKSLFLSRETYCAVVESVDTSVEGIERVVETEIPGVRPFTLNDIIPYRVEVENAVSAYVGFMDPQNEALRVFWSLVAETFAEDHQIIGYDVFTAAQNVAWAKRERREALARGEDFPDLDNPATAPIGDRSWCRLIRDWHVLPICSKSGGGENGEDIVALEAAGMCVAPTLIDQDPKVVKSLTAILQEVGVDTIQHDIMSDNRISRLLRTICVTTNDDMLTLLIEHSNIANLSGVQKHDLLAYFAVLCVKGEKSEVRFERVGLLPLFKTAALDSSFTELKGDTQYCCVDPSDPHANALGKLMPPGMVMLAWPTAQIKPIYERLNIKLCNGEEAMVNLIIPRLPKICAEDDDGKASAPFLLELHAYACIDRASAVIRAASQTAFVSSEDATRVGSPMEFTSPAGRCAAEFRETLGAFLPVWWMQQNEKYMEMLHALGMLPVLSASMILLCALELDTLAGAQKAVPANPDSAVSVPELAEVLRRKSYELVEEFARAAEEVWPKKSADSLRPESTGLLALPAPSFEDHRKAMQSILEASGLRILMARRHKAEATMKQDAATRNSRKPGLAEGGLRFADPELVAFRGVAFNGARPVTWTQCSLADHRAPPGAKATPHLKLLLENHSNGVFHIFGAFVQREHTPAELVMKHLGTLCSLMKSEPDLAIVGCGSILHDDFRQCWAHLSEHLGNPLSDEVTASPECMKALDRLKALPCVAVTSEDVADRPADVLMLAPPKYAFFQLPLLKGKEATLKLYLRHVHAETTREAQVFRTLGANDLPRAADYAETSDRVASKAKELGRANWEWVVAALDACVRGVYEDLSHEAKKGADLSPKAVRNLHLFAADGSVASASSLVWADEPRWQKRLERAGVMRFCALKDTADQRDLALVLVQGAGLGQLTGMVEERRVVEAAAADAVRDTATGRGVAFLASVEETLRSFEFARGLHAVLQHASEVADRGQKHGLAAITQEMRKVKFMVQPCRLRSGLFWKRGFGPRLSSPAQPTAPQEPQPSPTAEAPPCVGPPGSVPQPAAATTGKGTLAVGEAVAGPVGGVGDACPKTGTAAGVDDLARDSTGAEVPSVSPVSDTAALPATAAPTQEAATVASPPAAPPSKLSFVDNLISGSEQDQSVYFDQAEKVVYIGDVAEGVVDDGMMAELSFALRHAIPMLFDVDSFLLEALLRCAVRDGPSGIQDFLEKRDIRLDTLAPRHLGPGDPLPEDLQEHLLWSMHTTFGEGENAAVLHNDRFIIAEVSRWPDQAHAGDGLSRSYLMRISGDVFEPRKHFEVYKIHSRASASTCTDLAIIPDEGPVDKEPGADDVAGADELGGLRDIRSAADLKQLGEVKQYLREMAVMSQEDYKVIMRRLFKTWHPDKVGDTPLAGRIFNLLRMHEQWYKRKVSGEAVIDESWIDKEDLGEAEAMAKGQSQGSHMLALTGRTYVPAADGQQSSWFDEFEQEMRQAKADREAGLKRKAHPRMPEMVEREELPPAPESSGRGCAALGWSGPTRQSAQDGPTRMVDRQLSARFLQEAKVELVCVRRLLKEMDGLRTVPPRAVFHCQQAAEMAINSAMLRTCGLAEDEVAGGAAHDIIDFVKRIRTAEVNTDAQRRAQNVPISDEDVDWLKRAYLASRYPKPGRFGVPSVLYEEPDARRGLRLAEQFVEWAERVEDLPDPGKTRRRWNQFEESKTLTPVPGDPVAPPAQIPRFIPPPSGRVPMVAGPPTAAFCGPPSPPPIGSPSPSSPLGPPPASPPPAYMPLLEAVGGEPPAKVQRVDGAGEDVVARKRDAAANDFLAGSSKRPRTEALSTPTEASAWAGSASPDGAGAGAGATGKRWSRRLRKDGT